MGTDVVHDNKNILQLADFDQKKSKMIYRLVK